MKGIPDFTPSGALRDGATSCPYHSTRVPGYPRPERATGSQRGGYGARERETEGEVDLGGAKKERMKKSKPSRFCLLEQNLFESTWMFAAFTCMHTRDLVMKVRLSCLLSPPHIHTPTLERSG